MVCSVSSWPYTFATPPPRRCARQFASPFHDFLLGVMSAAGISARSRKALIDDWDVLYHSDGSVEQLDAVVWTVRERARRAARFGEIIEIDITFGTNNRRRPLLDFQTSSLDFAFAFLPDETEDTFR